MFIYLVGMIWNNKLLHRERLLRGLRRPSVCEGSIRVRAESSKPQDRWIKPAENNRCRWETAAYFPGRCPVYRILYWIWSSGLYTPRIWGNEELSFWNVTAEVSFWPQAEKGMRDTVKEKWMTQMVFPIKQALVGRNIQSFGRRKTPQ